MLGFKLTHHCNCPSIRNSEIIRVIATLESGDLARSLPGLCGTGFVLKKSTRSSFVTTQRTKLLWGFVLSALLAFFSPVVASQTSHPAVDARMERDFEAAMAAQDRGDMQQAETLLASLHTAHPGIFAVDESFGMLLVSRGDLSRALSLLEAAVREQPGSDAAHANLGAALYQMHRGQPALIEFERAVKLNPANASAQQSLGRLYMEDHRPEEAARAFKAALRLHPADADLQLDCIAVLLAAKHIDQARTMLSAIPNPDQSARVQSLLGEADEIEGKFQDAAEHFAHAVALEPNEENAWFMGVELLRHWTFGAAIAEFQAASAKFPNSPRMRFGLGAALFGDAKYAEAVPVFADLLMTKPDDALYAELLGISCNAVMQSVSPRCAALTTYAEAHPTDVKAATYAASLLLVEQDQDELNVKLARKLLQRALAADPNLPEAQFQMGVILQNNSNWAASIPYLERATKLKPDYAKAHYRLALAYLRTDRKQDGLAQMELQKKFARQEEADRDRRLSEITTFVVNTH
jgi:tetratricopeptide (TPR) repeat protein